MRLAIASLLMLMLGGCDLMQAVAQEIPRRVSIRVRETAGMRRFGYPTSARVPFARGVLKDDKVVRLLNAHGVVVPAQITAVARYDDGSVRWLEVDVVLSLAPLEMMEFQLEYGAGVTGVQPTRGLTFSESADTFQVSAYTIRKDGNPLVQQVHYGRDYLKGDGLNVAVMEGDVEHRLRDANNVKWTVEKQGVYQVRLRCDGEYPAQGDRSPLPFTLTLEFCSTKSWIGVTQTLHGAAERKVTLSLAGDFNLTGQLLWDTDVGYWLYGILNGDEQMRFSRTPSDWTCRLGKVGQETPCAVRTPDYPRARGWGHFQEAREDANVIAFGVANFDANGEYIVTMRGDGTLTVRHEPAAAAARQLRVFFHFIPVPLQRTAQTSPPAMMLPLEVTGP